MTSQRPSEGDEAPLPTPAEQQEAYRQRKAIYDERVAAWEAGGRVGEPPPRPVRPHTPGFVYREEARETRDGEQAESTRLTRIAERVAASRALSDASPMDQHYAALSAIAVLADDAEYLLGQITDYQKAIALGNRAFDRLEAHRSPSSPPRDISHEIEINDGPEEAPDSDTERLNWLEKATTLDTVICAPGNHGGKDENWLVCVEVDEDRFGRICDEAEAPTLREAIDAARAVSEQEKSS